MSKVVEATFALPDLGEGLTSAEIIEWLVEEGEEVKVDQPIVVVETVKATTDLPSPWTGQILRRCARVGEHVDVGADLFVMSGQDLSLARDHAAHLVGTPQSARPTLPAPQLPARGNRRTVPITPAVRRLARKLRVDLRTVEGTGPSGTVTEQDVERAATDESSSDQ